MKFDDCLNEQLVSIPHRQGTTIIDEGTEKLYVSDVSIPHRQGTTADFISFY